MEVLSKMYNSFAILTGRIRPTIISFVGTSFLM